MWIRANEAENAPLVSVWIDPEMRAFEAQIQTARDLPTSPVLVAKYDRHATDEDSATDKDEAGGPRRPFSLALASVAALLLFVLLIPTARSQTTGKITGTVQDQTEAGIPGATVVVANTATLSRPQELAVRDSSRSNRVQALPAHWCGHRYQQRLGDRCEAAIERTVASCDGHGRCSSCGNV